MKRLIYILAMLMIGCTSTKNIPSSKKRIIPPIVEHDRNLDTLLTCYIYQYAGLDSIHKTIAKIVKYDITKRVLSEQYQGFKESSYEGTANAIDYYDYKNEFVVQRRTLYTDDHTPSFRQQDSSKTVFFYDSNGNLERKQHFDFKRRLKAKVRKGLARSGDYCIDEDDLEKKSTWDITSEIFFKYDSLNRKIEYYAPDIHWGSQNRYTWSYYDDGKIKEHHSYEHDRLIWIEKYTYTDTSCQFIRTWYDNEGKPEHEKEKRWEYTSQITHNDKLDNKGRVVEESETDEKGDFLGRTVIEYNSSGQVSKKVKYNQDNEPDMTHIYKYKE